MAHKQGNLSLRILIDEGQRRDQDNQSSQRELEQLRSQIALVSQAKDDACRQNRCLQDELATQTNLARNAQRELATAKREIDDLKRQLQCYISEVRQVEDLLSKKEEERHEILDQYRHMSQDLSTLESQNHSLESEASCARRELKEVCGELDASRQQLKCAEELARGYEKQITDLTSQVAALESQVHRAAAEKRTAEKELSAARDLCVQIDDEKDKLIRRLSTKDSSQAELDDELRRLRQEICEMESQLEKERDRVCQLEAMLTSTRKESLENKLSSQDLGYEVSMLQQKVKSLQAKIDAQNADINCYQQRACDLDKEIETLRRRLSEEQLERARAAQESRRNSPRQVCFAEPEVQDTEPPLPCTNDAPYQTNIDDYTHPVNNDVQYSPASPQDYLGTETVLKDSNRASLRDFPRESLRDSPRQSLRDSLRETVLRDIDRDSPRDIGRETYRDSPREGRRDSPRENLRDAQETSRRSSRDAANPLGGGSSITRMGLLPECVGPQPILAKSNPSALSLCRPSASYTNRTSPLSPTNICQSLSPPPARRALSPAAKCTRLSPISSCDNQRSYRSSVQDACNGRSTTTFSSTRRNTSCSPTRCASSPSRAKRDEICATVHYNTSPAQTVKAGDARTGVTGSCDPPPLPPLHLQLSPMSSPDGPSSPGNRTRRWQSALPSGGLKECH